MTVRITSSQPAVAPGGPPPVFSVSTDREHFDVEVAADPALLDGTLAARRTQGNFFALRGVAGDEAPVRVDVDDEAWSGLRTARALYYRALAYEGSPDAPRAVETTVDDAAHAPAVEIAPWPTQPPPLRTRISARLPWLQVEGNRVVDPSGRIVVLRGINRPGMESLRRGSLDPTGSPGRTSREAAGITRAEVHEIVRGWNANVIRLPVNQLWALTRPEYIADIDQIVAWAAAEGAYTILALTRLDPVHAWGRNPDGTPNRVAPFPDETSIRLWRMFAARYAREPAVLYDLYSIPHEPLGTDEVYPFGLLATEEEWIAVWHTWARRIEAAVHRVNGRALLFVAGWDWGLNLRTFPVPEPGDRTLPNAVYAAHVDPGDTPGADEDFEYWFGFPRLREGHPIYVSAWGAADDQLLWAERLVAYLNDRATVASGTWQGVAGWCAWSWSEPPLLVERKTVRSGARSWQTFERNPEGAWIPTPFGRLVKAALAQPVDVPAVEARPKRPDATPVVAATPALAIGKGVGRGKPNDATDVRTVQDRLHALRFLANVDHERERPAEGLTGQVAEAGLAATIAAIELLEREVQGMRTPDGAVDKTGKTLAALNRALPRPTEAERAAVGAARASIVEDRIQGVTITAAVGGVAAAAAATSNQPDDVRAVQVRLVRLGSLRPDHTETPGEGAVLTPAALPATRAAIERFQAREVAYWKKANVVSGTVTSGVVAPADATHALLDLISTYVERLPGGRTVQFRDHPATPFTVHPQGDRGASYVGTESPHRLPLEEWTALGLTEPQARALRYLTANEGNFDAINTYDVARISFGCIQFAGGRGLPRFMALFKASRPDAFRRVFAEFGIDVEYNVVKGDVANAAVTVVDPPSARLLRGAEAETALQADPRLWAVFAAAGADKDVQLAQIDAAVRDYVRPPLGGQVEYTNPAGAATSAPLSVLLTSEKGLVMLIDRAVQEGPDTAAKRIAAAVRRVAVDQQLVSIGRAAPFEASVLRQVVFDLEADLELWAQIAAAVTAVAAVQAAAKKPGATVADALADPAATQARAALDAAVAAASRKSLYVKAERLTYVVSRDWLTGRIAPQRSALDFTPPPATPADAAAAAAAVQTALTALLPFKVAEAQDYLARLRAIRQRVAGIRDTTDVAGPTEPH